MVVGLAVYILASRWILRSWQGIPREAGIALVNLAGVFLCFFYDLAHGGFMKACLSRFH